MKRFLITLSVFLLGVLLINFGIYLVVQPVYQSKLYVRRFNGQMEVGRRTSIHTVVLADSHGLSFENELINQNGILNLSDGSDSYSDMFNKLRRALREFNIRNVILSLDPQNFSTYRDTNHNALDSQALLDGGTVLSQFMEYFPILKPTSNAILLKVIENSVVNLFTDPAQQEIEDLPWNLLEPERRREEAQMRFERQFPSFQVSETQLVDLKKILSLCQSNSIKVHGILFPLSNELLEFYREYKDSLTIFERAAQATGVRLFHYQNLFHQTDNNPDFFKDQDHLSPLGMLQFTEVFLRDFESTD